MSQEDQERSRTRIDTAREEAYWREQHKERADRDAGQYTYEQDYEPAYRYGWEARSEYPDKHWEDIQEELELCWEERRSDSRLAWNQARDLCQDAWSHCIKESPTSDQPSAGETPPP